MAVAIKNAPDLRPTSNPFDRMQIVALGGVVYTVGSLAILFKVIPMLWVALWGNLLGFQVDSFASYTLQAILMLAGAAGMVVLGGQLLGPKTQPGIRAGIFTAFVSLLLVVLLTRWYSSGAEHFAFNPEAVPVWGGKSIQGIGDFFSFLFATVLFLPSILGGWTGAMVMTIVIGVVLLGLFLRMFFSKRADRFLVGFEAQGWFSATSYKKNQGIKVRRGTILGILLLIGSGVWTLVSHNTLASGPPNWNLDIPFTGVTTFRVDALGVWQIGSAPVREELEKQHPDWFAAEKPANELIQSLKKLETSLEAARKKEEAAGKKVTILPKKVDFGKVRDRLETGSYLEGSNEALALLKTEINPALLDLKDAYKDADWVNALESAVVAVKKEAEETREIASDPLRLNRYLVKTINQKLDPATHVMLYDITRLDKAFALPVVVPLAASAKIKKERKENGQSELSELPPKPINGTETFATVTLLPAVKYTLPLLLLALTLWFAWRVVNLPVFTDFLIATEGELNKVSWTTRRRLFQDTVVVLVTLVLMAFYLFAMDQVWGRLLSWRPIGVIVFKDEGNQQNKGTEKPW